MEIQNGIEISEAGCWLFIQCERFEDVTLSQWKDLEERLTDVSGWNRTDATIKAEDASTVSFSVNRDKFGKRYLVASFSQRGGVYNSSVWDADEGSPLGIHNDRIVLVGIGRHFIGQLNIGGA